MPNDLHIQIWYTCGYYISLTLSVPDTCLCMSVKLFFHVREQITLHSWEIDHKCHHVHKTEYVTDHMTLQFGVGIKCISICQETMQ